MDSCQALFRLCTGITDDRDPSTTLLLAVVSGTLFTATVVLPLYRRWTNQRRLKVTKQRKLTAFGRELHRMEEWVSQEQVPAGIVDTILHATIPELRAMLLTGTVTATAMLRVFCSQALVAHKKTNCIAWVMLEDAVQRAMEADKKYALHLANPTACGDLSDVPLLGIPISIKENLSYPGTDATLGLIGNCFQPAPPGRVSGSVALLLAAGANVFVKTNVPALLLSIQCENALFGTTTNPFSARHTCGGSSGGEGALIALEGCAAGVGTDIGGSIRGPSAFCGLVGIKPTFLRTSNRYNNPARGDESIPSITGPMGRTVVDVVSLFRCMTPRRDSLADGTTNRIPFNEALYEATLTTKSLRVGYYEQDGFLETSPACARAVRVAVEALKANGHSVVSIQPPMVYEALAVFYQLIGADGCRRLRVLLGDDETFGDIKPLLALSRLPFPLRRLVCAVVSRKVSPEWANILLSAVEKRVDEYGNLLILRNQIRDAYADMMSLHKLDAVLCPGFLVPAPKLTSTSETSFVVDTTAYYNVLDVPVISLPVTKVQHPEDAWTTMLPNSNGMSRAVRSLYDSEEMAGLPVGVQIVTPRFTEEQGLAVAKRIEDYLSHWL